MATPKRLRQAGSNHIYGWTATLARRKDMTPYPPEPIDEGGAKFSDKSAEIVANLKSENLGHKTVISNQEAVLEQLKKKVAGFENAKKSPLAEMSRNEILTMAKIWGKLDLRKNHADLIERYDELVAAEEE